jgi:hypothetical protein
MVSSGLKDNKSVCFFIIFVSLSEYFITQWIDQQLKFAEFTGIKKALN